MICNHEIKLKFCLDMPYEILVLYILYKIKSFVSSKTIKLATTIYSILSNKQKNIKSHNKLFQIY